VAPRPHRIRNEFTNGARPPANGGVVPGALDLGLPMHGFALFIGDHLARSVRGVPGAPPA